MSGAELAASGATCPHRPPCPGCPRWGEPGIAPRALAALGALCAAHGIAPPAVFSGPALAHRHRARLMVRGRSTAPAVGLFRAGTHRVVDVPRCGVHHPLVNRVAEALRRAIRRTATRPYADVSHRGLLRAVQVAVERASGRAQVVLVACSEDPHSLDPLARELRRELGDALQGLFWNGNPARTNTILGPLWRRIAGEPMLRERIAGADVFYPPGAFGQGNLPLFERLAARVGELVPERGRVVEYHSGCGALGLSFAARASELWMNEREPAALEGLARGVAALPPEVRGRIRVLPGAAGEHAAQIAGAACVVVDPPRRGLDPELLDALCATPPRRLVAVSCSLDAFLRESARLAEAGLAPVEIRAYAFFPYTEHVETLALFERDVR